MGMSICRARQYKGFRKCGLVILAQSNQLIGETGSCYPAIFADREPPLQMLEGL